jgi:dienelactone hydrolase
MAAKEARGGAAEPGFDPRERQAAFRALAAFFQQQLNGD